MLPLIDVPTVNLGGRIQPVTAVPESVAGYRLVQHLGTGGMGVVHRGVTDQGAVAAVKLIRQDYCADGSPERFAAEWRALAWMDHPNISKLLGVGTLPDGRPYLVMEFIDGASLVRHCDERKLPLTARLALFAQVCDGVHHAHQKGILHRDLKPGNILVSTGENGDVPKIIDFGLARPVDDSTDRSDRTRIGVVLGTPQYMAPEQTFGNPHDVDTRTDVYALGAVLYELLTGTPPIGRFNPLDDPSVLFHRIRSQRIETPVQRLQSPDIAADHTTAELRSTTPAKLFREVRGDLSGVVLKAIDPVRDRRYDSAAALATDIRRVLAREPVLGVRVTAFQRGKKLVQRNPAATAAAIIALLAIVSGCVIAAVGMMQARAAERLANQRLLELNESLIAVEAAKAQTEKTLQESESAREAADLLSRRRQQTIAYYDDHRSLSRQFGRIGSPQAHAQLMRLSKQVAVMTALKPEQRLWMRSTFASLAAMMHRDDESFREQRAALDESTRLFGQHHILTTTIRTTLAQMFSDVRRYAEAVPIWEELGAHHSAAFGLRSPETLRARFALARAYEETKQTRDAIEVYRDALSVGRDVFGLDHVLMLQNALRFGRLILDRGNANELGEALTVADELRTVLFRDGRELKAIEGEEFARLGAIYVQAGRYEAAEPCLREAVILHDRSDNGTFQAAANRHSLAFVLMRLGNLTEAEAFAVASFEEYFARRDEARTFDPTTLNRVLNLIVEIQCKAGRERDSQIWEAKRAGLIRETAPPPRPRMP